MCVLLLSVAGYILFVFSALDASHAHPLHREPEPLPQQPEPQQQQQQQHRADGLKLLSLKHEVGEASSTPRPAEARRRVVAIGDIHGSMKGLRGAFRAAKLMDEQERWVGGTTVVVQMGDILDRGRSELEAITFLERMRGEAAAAGGMVHTLLGNHDALTVSGIFTYAPNVSGFASDRFAFGRPLDLSRPAVAKFPRKQRNRAAAFLPGGPAAMLFASTRPAVVRVGDIIFVHAFLGMSHVAVGLDALNAELRDWMNGSSSSARLSEEMWSLLQDRDYGKASSAIQRSSMCTQVAHVLTALQARQLVVGHTPQWTGLNSVCNNSIWRVDAGLSVASSLQRPIQVVEFLPNGRERILQLDFPFGETPNKPA